MNHLNLLILAAAFVVAAGCSNPADDVAAAKVSTVSSAPLARSSSQDLSQARRLVFGPETAKIEFIGSKVTGSHHGGFRKFEGELLVSNDSQLLQSGSTVVIDTASIWSDNERLTGHLKDPDFFDVEKFPTSTFVLTEPAGKGESAMVTGNLMLHGITKQISFPAKIQFNDDAVELEAEFSIDRFDFDMKYPGRADDLIRKEVVLKLAVRALPPAAASL
jgi:polyisoprenoid-binding protein YceI